MGFGDEFINVAEPPPDLRDGLSIGGSGGRIQPGWFARLASRFRDDRGQPSTNTNNGGIVLYFPYGEWAVEPNAQPGTPSPVPRWTVREFLAARAAGDLDALERLQGVAQANPWNADVILDRRITLKFRAGATLSLERGLRFAVQGTVDAEDTQIIREGADAMFIPAWANASPLPAVWWGVGLEPGRDEAATLERVLEAACERRRPWRRLFVVRSPPPDSTLRAVDGFSARLNRVLPALPVVLRGEIALRRSVRSGGRDPYGLTGLVPEVPVGARLVAQAPGALILRGVASGRTEPSARIVALPDFQNDDAGGGSALLVVDNARASSVQGIAFDARTRASRCLEFRARFADREMHEVLVKHCTFEGAREAQLQIGPAPEGPLAQGTVTLSDSLGLLGARNEFVTLITPLTAPGQSYPRFYPDPGDPPYPGGQGTFSSMDLSGLLITACDFRVPQFKGATGISLRASQSLPATVSFCRFTGDANAFVTTYAGSALIEGCSFQNDRIPEARRPISAAPFTIAPGAPPRTLYAGFEPADGADVALVLDVVDSNRANPLPGESPLGGVFVMGCLSRSALLLSTGRPTPFTYQRSMMASLVFGCLHTGIPGAAPRAASIQWGSPRLTEGPPQLAQPAAGGPFRSSSDPGLCVLGSSLAAPVELYYGATPLSLLGVRVTNDAPYRFTPVVEGITRRTVVLGYGALLALLLLVGCDRSPLASTDAADIPETPDAAVEAIDVVDATTSRDAQPTLDGGAGDAANALDGSASRPDGDGGARNDGAADVARLVFADLGPPRQSRHRCPPVTDGDPTIPAPRLIYPLSGLRATSRRPGFQWELAEGTSGARIEVCADPCCARVITAYDAEGTTQRPAQMLPPGVVWWRARGRKDGEYGRATSFTWEVGIKHRDAPIDTAWGNIRDINADGYDDVVAAVAGPPPFPELGDPRIHVLRGGASELTYSPDRYTTPTPQGFGGPTVFYGDMNGDGYADIGARYCQRDDGTCGLILSVHAGSRDGLASESMAFQEGTYPISFSDVNGDGFQDLVTTQRTGLVGTTSNRDLGRYVVMGAPGSGTGGISSLEGRALGLRDWGYLTAMSSVGDLNGDGYADLIVDDYNGGRNGRLLAFHGGANGIVPTIAAEVRGFYFTQGFGGYVYPLGDIDGDRLADFAMALIGRQQFALFRGSRATTLEFSGLISEPYRPMDASYSTSFGDPFGLDSGADMDGDGRAEVPIACRQCYVDGADRVTGAIYVYEWVDGLGLRIGRQYAASERDGDPVHFSERSQGIGDVNGDGFDDLAITSSIIQSPLRIFLGGLGGFNRDREWTYLRPPGFSLARRGLSIALKRIVDGIWRSHG
jgi:hypothetical protein